MLRTTGLAIVGVAAIGALATLGSDRWISAGYNAATSHTTIAGTSLVGDEAYWLNAARSKAILPAATELPELLTTRTFDIGTRLTIAGADRMNLDIVSATPVPPDSGLLDDQGRPLIMVTARERKGTRTVRFLVEADAASAPVQKSL